MSRPISTPAPAPAPRPIGNAPSIPSRPATPDYSSPPRYQPPADGNGTRTPGTISRPLPDASQPARPTPRPASNEPGRIGGRPVDSRYQPAPRIEAPTPAPDRGGNFGGKPISGPRKPANDAPPVSDRYAPRDTVRPVDGNSPAGKPGRLWTPSTTQPTPRPTANVAPIVAPVAPQLSAPKPLTSGVLAPRAASSWQQRHGAYHGCHDSYWRGYWDPWCCHDSWRWGTWWDWHFGVSCGSFGWNVSLWYPYWQCHHSYWRHCYHDTFWYGWSSPYSDSCYWWYPSTTYCPTYLYVPNTVYVTDYETPASSEIVAGGGVVGGGVIGSGVVGVARAVPMPEEPADLSRSLAAKYVELGDFYFRAGRFRDAAEAYGKARSYAPDDASVHFVLADAVFADGDYHYAAFLISEGLRLDANLAAADTDKRTFYGDAKVFEAQMAALDTYLAKTPYDAQVHFVRGYNLAFSGNADGALKAFRRVLEIAPEHRGAQIFAAAMEQKLAAAAAK